MKVIAKKNRELALINAQNTQNENRAEIITLVVPEEYESFNKKIVFITPDGTVWDIITNNEYKITNAITKYDKVDFYIWLTKEVDGESIDFRTKTRPLKFYQNKDASDEITDEEIHGVNTVVNLLEEEIEKVENLNIEATKIGDTTTVTITKKDGTTESVDITDGQNGQDGKDGKDAKINGKNSIEIEAGNNITIDNTENGIRINSTGGSGGTSNYNDLSNKPKINNVELNGNKSLNNLGIQPAGNYALESEIPDVSNFITNRVDDLINYYKKTEIFTKQEVNNLISAITTMDIQVVQTLPVQDISTTTIYLVPKTTSETNDAYDEYIYISNNWEQIGSTQVDLTGYATESWVTTQISEFLTQTQIQALINTAISEYTETDPTVPSYVKNITQANITSWNNKQNSISDLSTIRSGASAGATAVQPSDLATVATSGSYNDLSNTPSEVTESTVSGWGFTKNTGTITGITMNGASKGTSGVVNLGTVITQHQDISGKEDKTNKVTSISSSSTDTQYPSAKAVYNAINKYEIPSYWKSTVDSAIENVKTIQRAHGQDCVNFVWYSDIHLKESSGASNYGRNIPILSNYICEKLNIPFIISTGDSVTNSIESSEQLMRDDFDYFNSLTEVIKDKLINCYGNHDGAWGDNRNGSSGYLAAYAWHLRPRDYFNYLMKPQMKNINRNYSADGSYGYIDYTAQKLRIVQLNSFWVGDNDTYYENGTMYYDYMHHGGYGDEQLEWVANTALSFDESGWSVIFISHMPPCTVDSTDYTSADANRDVTILNGILSAYYNGTSYSGSYTYNSSRKEGEWANVNISVNYTNVTNKANLLLFMAGHCHKSRIINNSSYLPFPIATITCAANSSYDSQAEGTRTNNSTTETAFDIVSVCKDTGVTYFTRVGVGSDRDTSSSTYYSVTNNLTNVTNSSAVSSIAGGSLYSGTLTPTTGYNMDSVSVTMGGTDITSTAYSSSTGNITISSVTGNVIITATASQGSTLQNRMVVQNENLNKRISSLFSKVDGNGCFIADPIEVDITQTCPVEFRGFASNMGTQGSTNYGNSKVTLMDTSQNALATWYIARSSNKTWWGASISGSDIIGDLSTILNTNPQSGTKPSASSVKYVVFSPCISSSAITSSSLSGLGIYMY